MKKILILLNKNVKWILAENQVDSKTEIFVFVSKILFILAFVINIWVGQRPPCVQILTRIRPGKPVRGWSD